MTIEELKSLMRIPADASKEIIMQIFERIAGVLKNRCVIKYKNDEYRILDFEFYFYNKNHQDISVHPRNSDALCWYINDFGGIDLNFESKINKTRVVKNGKCSYKYELTDESYFGGILIRQIQRLSDNVIFDGPWKVADLFRILDATSQIQSNPVLVVRKMSPKEMPQIEFNEPEKRYNLLGSKKDPKAKADYNLQECFTDVSESLKLKLETELAAFAESPYRYCYKS
jgi:hypothetical protein